MKYNIIEEQVELIGFYAKDNIELCEKFTQGHVDVLKQHGFLHFKSYDSYWYDLENSYVIIALEKGKPVGGIRLEHRVQGRKLPFERVLGRNFPEVLKIEDMLGIDHIAEPCSLWNSKYVTGQNLSIYLSRASIAIAPLLNIKHIISFNATYTFRIPTDVGCTMIESVGDNGYFNYPTKQFRAALWLHSDLDKLCNAENESRERMLSLRDERCQKFLETFDNSKLLIEYDLKI